MQRAFGAECRSKSGLRTGFGISTLPLMHAAPHLARPHGNPREGAACIRGSVPTQVGIWHRPDATDARCPHTWRGLTGSNTNNALASRSRIIYNSVGPPPRTLATSAYSLLQIHSLCIIHHVVPAIEEKTAISFSDHLLKARKCRLWLWCIDSWGSTTASDGL